MMQRITPQYTVFDLNGHVSNAKYMDWCWNALGVEALTGRCIAVFDVEYDREVRMREKIRTELARDGEAFSFCGFEQDETRCFAIRGTLAEI
jgi:acyl-ACP thioesterase